MTERSRGYTVSIDFEDSLMIIKNYSVTTDYLVRCRGQEVVLHRDETIKMVNLEKGESLSFSILTKYL